VIDCKETLFQEPAFYLYLRCGSKWGEQTLNPGNYVIKITQPMKYGSLVSLVVY